MATAFSDSEKKIIKEKLHEVAKECLQKYGVKKTTVDQMAQKVGISKGSFYNFYPRKEILFFEVLEEYQESTMNDLTDKLKNEDTIGINQFTNLIYDLYQDMRHSFVMSIFQNQEMELLVRKLPKDMIMNHHVLDEILMEKILSSVKIRDEISADIVSASLRAIAMNMLHIEEIGKNQFDNVLKLLIKGFAQQIIEED